MPLDAQRMDSLLSSPQLPSLPAIALKIIGLVQEDEVDVDKIAQTISLDPALSSKMLKIVNSSFYGLPKTVASVHQAVIVLGLNSVKTLALGFSLVNNLTGSGGDGLNHMAFWRRSLYSAIAAKQLCERLHIVQAEEVFIASLLQDVGVLAMTQVLGGEYAQIMQRVGDDYRSLGEAERAALGGDHTEVGAALAESWGLPPLLVESIRLHERPDDAPENLKPLIRTVRVGTLAADLIEHPDDEAQVGHYFRVLESWFAIDHTAAEELLRVVFKNASETQRLFELPTGELAHPDVILSKAGEMRGKLAANAQTSACIANHNSLQSDEIAAAEPEKIDTLTGLGSRRVFDEQLDERFLTADSDQPISLVFVDVDEFKRVNDEHGEAEGDAVLRSLANTLKLVSAGKGEAFRFREDEFTVLCPGVGRQAAAVLAEAIRLAIEQAQFGISDGHDGKAVSVTASIGVATYEGEFFKRAEQLVKAASQGVFAAKGVGRNVVRVFVPRDATNDVV